VDEFLLGAVICELVERNRVLGKGEIHIEPYSVDLFHIYLTIAKQI